MFDMVNNIGPSRSGGYREHGLGVNGFANVQIMGSTAWIQSNLDG